MPYYMERWTSRRLVKSESTVEDITDVAQAGLAAMINVFSNNEAAYGDLGNEHSTLMFKFLYDFSISSLRRGGSSSYAMASTQEYCDGQNQLKSDIDKFRVDLTVAIDTQAQFIKKLTDGVVTNSIFVDAVGQGLSSAKVFEGLLCRDCGNIVTKAAYTQHLSSLKCMKDTTDRDVRENGWSEVNHGPHIVALKKSGVPIEIRPSGYTIWAEPWVMSAMEAFDKNKGFAGMKLSDYILRMKPTDEDK